MPLLRTWLRTLLGAVLMALLTNAAAEATGWRWRNTSDRDQGYLVFPVYREQARSPEVVFLGSSLTRWGVQARLLEEELSLREGRPLEVWNLGVHGGTAPQLREAGRIAFSKGAPRLLVVEARPGFWNERRTDPSVLFYWRWFAPLDETLLGLLDRPWAWTEEGLVRAVFGARALWRQGQFLLQPALAERWRKAELLDREERGSFWPRSAVLEALRRPETVDEALWARALARKEERLALLQPFASGHAWRGVLEELVERCRAAGTRLVLFLPPVSGVLQEAMPPGLREAHLAWMQEVAGPEAVVLDLDPLGRRLGPAHWFDLDHLNARGAGILSGELLPRLRGLLEEAPR